MKLVKPRVLVLAILLASSFLMVTGFGTAAGQLTSQRPPPLIPFDGTMSKDVAGTLNLDERMTLLKQDYDYCTKIGITNADMSDKCREFLNSLDNQLNIMLTGEPK